MDLKTYTTGIQHIGIPTNDIEKTIAFYQKLGFEIALQTVNEEADEKVAFLELETLVIETYENKAAKMESGAIDHVAINVKDIEEVYRYIEAEKMNTTKDTIHFLPFWDNGVRFFTIEGPNKEKVEFPHTWRTCWAVFSAIRFLLWTGSISDRYAVNMRLTRI